MVTNPRLKGSLRATLNLLRNTPRQQIACRYFSIYNSLKSNVNSSYRTLTPATCFVIGLGAYAPRAHHIRLRVISTFAQTSMSSFYDLKPLDSKKQPFDFAQLKGKVVLIVNVASKCGFTKQYADLEALYKKYNDKGLEIIGFPCNQFGGQEPGSAEEVASFCTLNYGVTFPVLNKIEVNGSNADPVYVWLKSHKSGFLGFAGIKWNFEKFLIDTNGNVINRWGSITNPSKLEGEIEKALKNVKA